MPGWLLVLIGIIGGFGTIAGALYLAFRPYLQPFHKPWMPDPTGRNTSSVPDTLASGADPEAGGHL